MNHRDEQVELKKYYESSSTIHLVEIYINEGLTKHALSLLEKELLKRGHDPQDLTKESLDKLLIESGCTEGIDALSYSHPISNSFQRCLNIILNKNNRLKQIATTHPVLFSIILVAVLPYLLGLIFAVIDYLSEETFAGVKYNIRRAEILSFVVWIFIIWRLRWFRGSGFLSIGRLSSWLTMFALITLEYVILVCFHPGQLDSELFITFGHDYLKGIIPTYLLFAIFEEVGFRGLMLYCLFRVYGINRIGIFKVVLLTSIVFGLVHTPSHIFNESKLIYVILSPLPPFIAGIMFCALLLHGKCIWIPILYHAMSNTLSSFVGGIWWVDNDDRAIYIINYIMAHWLVLIVAVYLLFRVEVRSPVQLKD